MLKTVLCGSILSAVALLAQTNSPVAAGYTAPAPVSVAPGQILTFFLDGLDGLVSKPVRAPSGALPNSLAGISVTLRQGSDHPVPMLEVRPVSTCPSGGIASPASCAGLIAVTVQIPYELVPLCPLCLRPTLPPAQLFVTANGTSGTAIELNALADQVHILTACDVVLQQFGTSPLLNTSGLPCAPVVTHADGSLVTAASPASVGETLVAWAVGLGQTNPAASTGQPATSAAPAIQTFSMNFNYEVNALPTRPFTGRPDVRPPQPAYAGIAPGFPGLYVIDFTVPPEPPNGTPRCALPGTFGVGANVAQSNLTVSFGGGFSFDGAGICVATRIPID